MRNKYATISSVFALIFGLSILSFDETAELMISRLSSVSGNQRIDLLVEIATVYGNTNFDKSLDYASQAFEQAGQQDYPLGEASACYLIGKAHFSLNQMEQTIEWAERACVLLEKTGETKWAGYSHNRAGDARKKTGDKLRAQAHYKSAKDAFKSCGSDIGLAIACQNLGLINWEFGALKPAMLNYQEALDINISKENHEQVSSLLNNMGVVFFQWGILDKALEKFLNSLEISEKYNFNKNIPLVLVNIGLVYIDQSQPEKALPILNDALKRSKKIKNKEGEAYALNNLGLANEKLGQDTLAWDYYQNSLKVYESIGSLSGVLLNKNGLGRVLIIRGEYQKAIALLESSRHQAQQEKDRVKEAIALLNLGDAYEKQGDHEKTPEIYYQSLSMAKEINQNKLIKKNLARISRTYAEIGNYKKALKISEELSIVKEQAHQEVSQVEIANLQSRFNSETKEKENVLLRTEKGLQEEVIKNQRTVFYSLGIVLILLLGLLFVMHRSNRKEISNNQLLETAHKTTLVHQAKLEATNLELNKALEEVKTLGGLLPICSTCKKIRDDKGYWQQVEVYVMKHTEANFTHSICPVCVKDYHRQIEEVRKRKAVKKPKITN